MLIVCELSKKTSSVYIAASDEEKVQSSANSFTWAVRQLTVHQQITIAKKGTLPHLLYFNKIYEVAEKTDTYSVDVVKSSDMEKEVPHVAEQHKVLKVESTEEEKAGHFLVNQD